jgi:hypothetical protein
VEEEMKKLLTVATLLLLGTATAGAVVYTIPADYEKIHKLAEGLLGTSNLSTVSPDKAKNSGANVNAFVSGATGKNVYDSYSPTYFESYGRNYREFVKNATGVDPGSTTSYTSFLNAGRNYRYLAEGLAENRITTSSYTQFQYAGRNYLSLAEQLTGADINSYNPNRYGGAGKSVSNGYYYAGRNVRSATEAISSSSVTTYDTSGVATRAQQFKQRADQTFYDMYVNPNGLSNAFTKIDNAVLSLIAGMTTKSRANTSDIQVPRVEVSPFVQLYAVRETEMEGDLYEGDYYTVYNLYGVSFLGDSWKVTERSCCYGCQDTPINTTKYLTISIPEDIVVGGVGGRIYFKQSSFSPETITLPVRIYNTYGAGGWVKVCDYLVGVFKDGDGAFYPRNVGTTFSCNGHTFKVEAYNPSGLGGVRIRLVN